MVEEQRERIDEAMKKMVDDIDKSHLRIFKARMFRCAAACCEDKNASVTSVQRCIETCGLPLQNAEKFFQQELDYIQNRLQRCIMTCNDSIRDKMGNNANESEVNKYTREFEGCAKKCVDSYLDLIPNTMKKIKDMLNKSEFQVKQ